MCQALFYLGAWARLIIIIIKAGPKSFSMAYIFSQGKLSINIIYENSIVCAKMFFILERHVLRKQHLL